MRNFARISGIASIALVAFVVAGCGSDKTSPDDRILSTSGAGAAISAGNAGSGGVDATETTAAGSGGGTAVMGGTSLARGGNGGTGRAVVVGGKGGVGGKAGSKGGAGASGKAGASTGGTGGSQKPYTCPATSTLKAGDTNGTIQSGGQERTFILHVPTSYSPKTPMPLVLDWHGIGSTAAGQQLASGYPALGDQEGFITVLPQGINNAWNIGVCCTQSRDVDDEGFARDLVTKISSEGCIDQKRIYSVGYSMGGGMSHYLGCNAADIFAAVAPAAFDLLTEEEEPCHPSRPITVISFRGDADPVVYYRAHESTPPTALLGLGYSLDPIHFIGPVETLQKWAALDGCTGSPEDKGGGCQTYTSCKEGVEVTLCTAAGGGHVPGDAKVGWAMLKKHPMP